jgi:hypothetical protein
MRRKEILEEMVLGCEQLRNVSLVDALFNLVVDVVTSPRLLPLIPIDSSYGKYMFFFSLPNHVCLAVIGEWLELKDFGNLDSAIVNLSGLVFDEM